MLLSLTNAAGFDDRNVGKGVCKIKGEDSYKKTSISCHDREKYFHFKLVVLISYFLVSFISQEKKRNINIRLPEKNFLPVRALYLVRNQSRRAIKFDTLCLSHVQRMYQLSGCVETFQAWNLAWIAITFSVLFQPNFSCCASCCSMCFAANVARGSGRKCVAGFSKAVWIMWTHLCTQEGPLLLQVEKKSCR